jgi:hypothetical protein
MTAELVLFATVVSVTILAVAGLTKVAAPGPVRYRALAGFEVLVACGAVAPQLRVPSLAIMVALASTFVGNALVADDKPCRCFGERLATSSRGIRLFRSGGLLAFSAVGLLASLVTSPSAPVEFTLLTITAAVITGVFLIVFPSYVEHRTELVA